MPSLHVNLGVNEKKSEALYMLGLQPILQTSLVKASSLRITPMAQNKTVMQRHGLYTLTVGEVELPLTVNGVCRPNSFCVMQSSGPKCILGYLFLRRLMSLLIVTNSLSC